MRIAWTKIACHDLEAIEEHVRKDSPREAVRRVLGVIDAVEQSVSLVPGMGQPGPIARTMEFGVTGTPYRVACRVKKNVLEVLRVLNNALQYNGTNI
jgi:plasmid stabilization system protein ParE